MLKIYFFIFLLFNFLKPLQLAKLAVWKLPIYNLPLNSTNVFVLASIPDSPTKEDLKPKQSNELNAPANLLQNSLKNLPYGRNSKLLVNNKYSSISYEDSAEIGGINYYHISKHQNKKSKCDIRSYNYGMDKIVGGVEVDINLYPYHVAYGNNCGGAIIDKKWIMTAGHCGIKTYIRAGSKYMNQGKKVEVKTNYIHPGWLAKVKEHPFDYDYQLLELKEPLKFDDNVQKIKIARMEDMVAGSVMTVTGWGHTYENGAYSSVLRAVRLPIIPKVNCQSVPYPYYRGSLTPRMFCAGYSEGKKDACQGDSGGPAVVGDRLLGVISFGYGCATPGAFGVYSKVANVRDWIEETTGIAFD